jgi:hypothetical protein
MPRTKPDGGPEPNFHFGRITAIGKDLKREKNYEKEKEKEKKKKKGIYW